MPPRSQQFYRSNAVTGKIGIRADELDMRACTLAVIAEIDIAVDQT